MALQSSVLVVGGGPVGVVAALACALGFVRVFTLPIMTLFSIPA